MNRNLAALGMFHTLPSSSLPPRSPDPVEPPHPRNAPSCVGGPERRGQVALRVRARLRSPGPAGPGEKNGTEHAHAPKTYGRKGACSTQRCERSLRCVPHSPLRSRPLVPETCLRSRCHTEVSSRGSRWCAEASSRCSGEMIVEKKTWGRHSTKKAIAGCGDVE